LFESHVFFTIRGLKIQITNNGSGLIKRSLADNKPTYDIVIPLVTKLH